MSKTMTEIMESSIEINCYLCGKGKITIRSGDLHLQHKHPLSSEVENKWRLFLMEKSKEFFDSLKEPDAN